MTQPTRVPLQGVLKSLKKIFTSYVTSTFTQLILDTNIFFSACFSNVSTLGLGLPTEEGLAGGLIRWPYCVPEEFFEVYTKNSIIFIWIVQCGGYTNHL